MARYLDLQEFKDWWHDETFSDNDLIEAELVATEQAIDNTLLRRIELAGDTASARSFRPRGHCQSLLAIDDAAEIVSVVDGSSTLTAGVDFVAEPLNGLSTSGDPRPFHALVRAAGSWTFDGPLPAVTVTARWGWTAIPSEIVSGGRIEAADRIRNRDVQNGLVAITEGGGVGARVNKTVERMIRHYRHPIRSVAL